MGEDDYRIPRELIENDNRRAAPAVEEALESLSRTLARQGIKIGQVVDKARAFAVGLPSWGMVRGGTRFGRFPLTGQPRTIFEKIDDAATVHELTAATPGISLHFPWDFTPDLKALKSQAAACGLRFEAVNSNTFEDQPGQRFSYKYGSLSHVDRAVREQAIAHNLEVVEIGKRLGARALSIWIGDGSNFPGQTSLRDSFQRYLESLQKIYRRLPANWTLLIEYKPFEPAFYYTVLADWGCALMAAQAVGERCLVLVDLGHHLPGTNVEMIVARLLAARRLGGFHFNDSKYADDDLTAGSIDPARLFRIFHELVLEAERRPRFRPAYLIDQSHNLKDPIEALIQTVLQLQEAYLKALLVDREALAFYQKRNDVLMAERELQHAFALDVRPIAAQARLLAGAALDPIAVYRASGYRKKKAKERGG